MSKGLLKVLSFGRLKKHKKLPEEWGESIKQPVEEGMCFYVKYLGSQVVSQPSSEKVTAEAIKSIILMAKSKGLGSSSSSSSSPKKLPRVSLCIRPSGITTTDVTTGEVMHDVSIYRISYCSADSTYDRVVAFIATNRNECHVCHAFLTSKKKVSQAAALTISQAFAIAFENWENSKNGNGNCSSNDHSDATSASPNKHQQQQQPVTSTPMKGKSAPTAATPVTLLSEQNHNKDHLIDLSFGEEVKKKNTTAADAAANPPPSAASHTPFDADLDDSFSRLAQSRAIVGKDCRTHGAHGDDHHDHENMHPHADLLMLPSLLPSNIKSLDLDDEMRECFTSQRNTRDDKFFEEKDDLLFL